MPCTPGGPASQEAGRPGGPAGLEASGLNALRPRGPTGLEAGRPGAPAGLEALGLKAFWVWRPFRSGGPSGLEAFRAWRPLEDPDNKQKQGKGITDHLMSLGD